ncbi:MAG TPA: hypothetical protein VFO01_09625 [Trebonia sp.]|nr:hypothetical protein [Trebonia sp.]
MTYSFTDEEMARLHEAMDRAPSILRQRPWDLRRVADDRVELRSVPDHHLGKLLPREVIISCGAALYNLRLAIRVAGRQPSVWLLPDLNLGSGLLTTVTSEETRLASVEVTQGRPAPPDDTDQELYEALWLCRTDRRPYQYVPVPAAILAEMEDAAAHEHCWLRTLPGHQRRQALHAVASANKRLRKENKLTERLAELNMVRPAGFGPAPEGRQAEKTPPARPASWLEDELTPFENRLRTPPAARRRTQLMALSTDDDRPLDWLRAGEALQHALLHGTRLSMSAPGGASTPCCRQSYYAPLDPRRLWRRRPAPNGYAVQASFLTQSLELADLRDLGTEGLAALGLANLTGSRPGKDRWRWPWRWYFTEIPQVLMSVGYAEVKRVTAPGAWSTEPMRRPAHDSTCIVPSPRPAYDASYKEPIPRHPDDDSRTGSPGLLCAGKQVTAPGTTGSSRS